MFILLCSEENKTIFIRHSFYEHEAVSPFRNRQVSAQYLQKTNEAFTNTKNVVTVLTTRKYYI